MIFHDVHVIEDWATLGHRVIVRGRPYPGGRSHYLRADGEWEEIKETGWVEKDGHSIGFTLPEGALDAIVQEYLKVAAPEQATERHLDDARSVRDRLLALIEKRGLR